MFSELDDYISSDFLTDCWYDEGADIAIHDDSRL